MNVVSAHVVMRPGADATAVLDEVCACLSDDFDMEHSTIQLGQRTPPRGDPAPHRLPFEGG